MREVPNWYVITGGPSCGKTSVVDALHHRGYKTVKESARHYMELQLINGRDIAEIRLGQLKLQHEVLNRQVATERDLDREEVTFLDRALPDSLAYYKYLNLPPDEKLVNALQSARYNKIFILDLLPLKNDDVRIEDLAAQKEIHSNIIKIYIERGEEIVAVPVMSIKERVEFILNNL